MSSQQHRVRLRRRPSVDVAVELDPDQQAVVNHRRGPLLVLAGPGTGKTTTIVEAVSSRLTGPAPIQSSDVLVLTFGRAAALDLRARIAARLDTLPIPTVATFHSFGWQLLRGGGDPDTTPARLLSGPEQDLAIRDLLAGEREVGSARWPERLRPALATAGMSRELRALMAAVRARGLEPDEFAAVAEAAGLPDWTAAAAFFEEYLTVLDMRGAVDYAEVVHRARAHVLGTPELRGKYQAIYVDEYQDTDPAQVALLQALTVASTSLVAVGDPDQAIYRFRGADVRGLLNFPDDFPTPEGNPAPITVLRRTRRFGPEIREVADSWISPVGLGTLPGNVRSRHRSPECMGPPGQVELLSHDSEALQAEAIADLLRRAHLTEESPLAWSDMAVLVRSAVMDLPRLQRALTTAGVPVEVPASDIPLGQDPAVAPLLVGLQLAHAPEAVTVEEVRNFLESPLVGLHALDVRRLARALRAAERSTARTQQRSPLPSKELLLGLMTDRQDSATSLPADLQERLEPVLDVLSELRSDLRRPLRDQLWTLWSMARLGEGSWATELRHRALAGGNAGRTADRVLDSVVALFDLAARLPTGSGATDVVASLRNQQIPAARPADGTFHRDAVRLLTVHRAKGGEWPLVVVVGMQQDLWPDVRTSSSLLQAERLGVNGVEEPLTRRQILEDERRLAFVAATRARSRLVISCVESQLPDQPQPSLFIDEVRAEPPGGGEQDLTAGAPTADVPDRVPSRLTASALTASLRTTLLDPTSSPALRAAAAARLVQLAGLDGGRGLSAAADPRRWWGMRPLTVAPQPLTAAGEPVSLSATAVTSVGECPLRWFLDRRAAAGEQRDSRLGFGSVLHAVVAGVIDGEVAPEAAAMAVELDGVWDELPFETGWQSEQDRHRAVEALDRFLAWRAQAITGRTETERPFRFPLESPSGGVEMRGSIDLVAADQAGGGHVVDFKTGATVTSVAEAETNVQLGVYQLALELDGPEDLSPAGGELVYLGVESRKDSPLPKVRSQSPLLDGEPLREQIRQVEEVIRSEDIAATPGPACRTCAFNRVCPAKAEGFGAEIGGVS
jgi:superfamily I DNA/RNA helicase/RecB family exonuclease